jgi:hypothetical protein
MKKTLLLLFLATALFSCKSEYEERLAQAQVVRIKIEQIESIDQHESNSGLKDELEELHEEITFLSKVSGNEEKFLEDLFK